MNKDFNIVFLGGSITEGGGASDYKKSYVSLIGEFLKETYLDYSINIINSGASSSDSKFALFRLERDVISYKPNVVFVEFAVNDRICNPKEVSIYMEGIVRKLLKLDVPPAIIFLVTPTEMSDACGDVHKKIAYYYNTPVVDIQDYIWREIGKGNITWNGIACDSLHPNDLGHKLYADYVISFLKENDIIELKRQGIIKAPLMNYEFNNPKLVSYEEATFYGHWREEDFQMARRMELAAVSDVIGDCIKFDFKGRYIGFSTLLSKDGGILEISIDGNKCELDLYSTNNNYFTIADLKDLQDTRHSLMLRVSERKNPNSSGNKIVIGNFLLER